jgi:hypothetical protein
MGVRVGRAVRTQDLAAAEGRTLGRTVREILGDDPPVEVREMVTVGHPAHVLVDLAARPSCWWWAVAATDRSATRTSAR